MAIKPRKRYKNAQARRGISGPGSANNNTRRTPITVEEIAPSGNDVAVTFDQPVVLGGTPQYAANGGNMPASAALTSTNIVTLSYPGPVASLTVPFQDPSVRNGAGGYVLPGSFSAPG